MQEFVEGREGYEPKSELKYRIEINRDLEWIAGGPWEIPNSAAIETNDKSNPKLVICRTYRLLSDPE